MKFIIIDNIPTLVSLLTVIIFYKKLQPAWLQLFLYFLLITFATDIGAALYSHYLKKSNHFIVNFYSLIAYNFYFLTFYKAFETKSNKVIVSASFLVYISFFLNDALFINGPYNFNTYSSSVGSILLVLCCLLYFMWLFTSDGLINYFRIPMFWIATGLLFFYVGSLVQNSLVRYIIDNHLDPDGRIYHFIMVTLNVLLYGAFTISFICNQVWKKAL